MDSHPKSIGMARKDSRGSNRQGIDATVVLWDGDRGWRQAAVITLPSGNILATSRSDMCARRRTARVRISGDAGAGKTQICLQLLLQAQLPPDMGGLGGKSYVLTCGEGGFPSRRLRQMSSQYRGVGGVDPGKLMDGVCIQNARNLDEQMKIMMEILPVLMESHKIKLVVIDSIAALFRSDLGRGRSDMGERSRLLGMLSQQMKRLSDLHSAAFVVVNQVTARPVAVAASVGAGAIAGGRTGTGGGNVPAMGLFWSQCINTRFMVRRKDSRLPLRPSPSVGLVTDGLGGASGGRQRNTGGWTSQGTDEVVGSGRDQVGLGAEIISSTRTAIAREITLEMSPSMPVHMSCGFIVSSEGVSGVGWDMGRDRHEANRVTSES